MACVHKEHDHEEQNQKYGLKILILLDAPNPNKLSVSTLNILSMTEPITNKI